MFVGSTPVLDEGPRATGLPSRAITDPKSIYEKLMGAGARALDLSAGAIDTFRAIKTGWDSATA